MIIDKAFQRIGDRFVIEDDTCYLTVQSAKDMNMSDAVFDLVKQSVNSLMHNTRLMCILRITRKGL